MDNNIIANLNIGEEAVVKNCKDNKVYVVTLVDNGDKGMDLLLKTVYKDGRETGQFMPRKGQTLYRVYKDNTLHRFFKK